MYRAVLRCDGVPDRLVTNRHVIDSRSARAIAWNDRRGKDNEQVNQWWDETGPRSEHSGGPDDPYAMPPAAGGPQPGPQPGPQLGPQPGQPISAGPGSAYSEAEWGAHDAGTWNTQQSWGEAPQNWNDGSYWQPPAASAAPAAEGKRTGFYVVSALAAVLIILLAALSLTLWLTRDDGGTSPSANAPAVDNPNGQAAPVPTPESLGDPSDTTTTNSATSSTTPSSSRAQRPDPPAGVSLCTTNSGELFSRAGIGSSVTTCGFADAVRSAYLASGADGGPATVEAYSEATEQSYTMQCAPAGENIVRCTGGNDAVVYIY